MEFTTDSGLIKTRFFILSDTHGIEFKKEEMFSHHADVAIHCGDLTEESKLEEFQATWRLLMNIQAPLKLVIAGNHDFTMDIAAFEEKIANAWPPLDADLVRRVYGHFGEARQLFKDARSAGIIFLDEGSHRFNLKNGAALSVYASPYTPLLGGCDFQYHPSQGHKFEILKGVDLVMTHGPPKGIMDYTDSRQRSGCPDLFEAIARARPRLHCFGHIHEGWGARMVTWRQQLTERPSHFTDIDNDTSTIVEKLSGFKHSKLDTPESRQEKSMREQYHWQQRCYATTHCTGDAIPLEYGAQTLFINAAIQGTEEKPLQLPWLVELELKAVPRSNLHSDSVLPRSQRCGWHKWLRRLTWLTSPQNDIILKHLAKPLNLHRDRLLGTKDSECEKSQRERPTWWSPALEFLLQWDRRLERTYEVIGKMNQDDRSTRAGGGSRPSLRVRLRWSLDFALHEVWVSSGLEMRLMGTFSWFDIDLMVAGENAYGIT